MVVAAIESYGRLFRLTQNHAPVSVEINVDTKFTGEHEHGFDTVAEIPGTDPKLKEQVVMLGGHLDSWIAGTGATDNGAGTIVAMEAVRILRALDVKPRRTIRIALWTGEEQGIFGSKGYCTMHFGSAATSTAPDQMQLPEFMRRAAGPLTVKPEQKLISAYFNVDNGTGKIRGVYTQGNAAIAPIFAQWIAPLKDLGVHRDYQSQHRRHRSPELRRGRHSGIPVHPGHARLREPHASLQPGCGGTGCNRRRT